MRAFSLEGFAKEKMCLDIEQNRVKRDREDLVQVNRVRREDLVQVNRIRRETWSRKTGLGWRTWSR